MRRLFITLAAALALVTASATALADNSVTQTVNGGSRTATVADATLAAVNYSHSDQSNAGTLTLTVDDSSGTGDGWNVTIQSSNFVYTGVNNGTDIPAANFSITAANAPVLVAGQAIDATNGPKVSASPTGSLDVARKVIEANAGYGQGTYTQVLDVSLTVPGGSRAGTYTATLTVTIAAGPGA
ncbi:MAG: hypothetical protein Kow0010_24800 [Dehalococcoidia bacterium]